MEPSIAIAPEHALRELGDDRVRDLLSSVDTAYITVCHYAYTYGRARYGLSELLIYTEARLAKPTVLGLAGFIQHLDTSGILSPTTALRVPFTVTDPAGEDSAFVLTEPCRPADIGYLYQLSGPQTPVAEILQAELSDHYALPAGAAGSCPDCGAHLH